MAKRKTETTHWSEYTVLRTIIVIYNTTDIQPTIASVSHTISQMGVLSIQSGNIYSNIQKLQYLYIKQQRFPILNSDQNHYFVTTHSNTSHLSSQNPYIVYEYYVRKNKYIISSVIRISYKITYKNLSYNRDKHLTFN